MKDEKDEKAGSKWGAQYPQFTVNTGCDATSTTPSLDVISRFISEAQRAPKIVYLITNVHRDDVVYRFDEKYTRPGYAVFVGSRRVYELVSTATLSTTHPPLAGVSGVEWTVFSTTFYDSADLGAIRFYDAVEMLQRYLTPEGALAMLRATWTFSVDMERSGVEGGENGESDKICPLDFDTPSAAGYEMTRMGDDDKVEDK